MKRLTNEQIIAGIKEGKEQVFIYLSKKFFPSARRLMIMRGISDSQTPQFFSDTLASVIINFLKRRTVHDIDFETSLFSSLNEHIKQEKKSSRNNDDVQQIESESENNTSRIVALCVSVLDEQSQNLLFARMVEKLSYEKIAERFQYSNAVIAQYEMHKALNLLEGIVKARMNN